MVSFSHRFRGLRPSLLLACALVACGGAIQTADQPTPTASKPYYMPEGVPARSGAATLAPSLPMPVNLGIDHLREQFAYDQRSALHYSEENAADVGGVSVRDVSYDSPRGGRAEAILAVPAGAGPFAGIVFMGGLGATRLAMRADAIDYARRGAVGISVSQSQTRPGHATIFSYAASDRDEIIATVLDLRRAVDILLARGDVDAGRIGFEGFSHGAATGGILAGVEHRISAFLLKSGGSLAFLDRDYPTSKGGKAAYLALMASVDQIRYIGFVAPNAVFLQNGTQDGFFGLVDMSRWHTAASDPKTTKLYEAGHELNAQATADGIAWLTERLKLQQR